MSEAEPIPPTSSVTALRIPMIKKGEYDLWSMKMRQYIAITDHILWDIITNGDQATTDPASSSAPKTSLAANARRNNEKALNILLSAIPDRHLLSFHDAADARTLWSAIKARFGGNEASKKMQKNLLKHFKLQLRLSQEDANLKFLRSLPSVWHVVATMIRGQPGLDELEFDDLYNNLKVTLKQSTTDPENISKGYTQAASSKMQTAPNCASHSDEIICSFFSQQASVPTTHDDEDLLQIDEDAMKEIDIRWQVAMITARIRKFMRKTGRPIDLKPKNGITFDKANGRQEKKIVAIDVSNSKALVATDNNEEIDWTKEFDAKPVTFAMMALTELEEDDWSLEFDADHVHFGQDGLGDFDWSNIADDTSVSLALMATNSEVQGTQDQSGTTSKGEFEHSNLLRNLGTASQEAILKKISRLCIIEGLSWEYDGDKEKLSDFNEFQSSGYWTLRKLVVEELKVQFLFVPQICDKKLNDSLHVGVSYLIPKFKFVDEDLVILELLERMISIGVKFDGMQMKAICWILNKQKGFYSSITGFRRPPSVHCSWAPNNHRSRISYFSRNDTTDKECSISSENKLYMMCLGTQKSSHALADESWVEAMQKNCFISSYKIVWVLCDLQMEGEVIGTKWVLEYREMNGDESNQTHFRICIFYRLSCLSEMSKVLFYMANQDGSDVKQPQDRRDIYVGYRFMLMYIFGSTSFYGEDFEDLMQKEFTDAFQRDSYFHLEAFQTCLTMLGTIHDSDDQLSRGDVNILRSKTVNLISLFRGFNNSGLTASLSGYMQGRLSLVIHWEVWWRVEWWWGGLGVVGGDWLELVEVSGGVVGGGARCGRKDGGFGGWGVAGRVGVGGVAGDVGGGGGGVGRGMGVWGGWDWCWVCVRVGVLGVRVVGEAVGWVGINPDLIDPWLQQFWATASLRVINEVPHIRAMVAGKRILISEETITADLLFDDADGVDCFPKQWNSGRISNQPKVQLFFDDNEWNARTYFQWYCVSTDTADSSTAEHRMMQFKVLLIIPRFPNVYTQQMLSQTSGEMRDFWIYML
ncbi:hypothetical protein Tco_1213149 [Tanacetum coccineum]